MDPMQSRKAKHIDVCLTEAVDYQTLTTGFERVTLPYNALTQTNLGAIDLHTEFLGVALDAPVLIGAMTGGCRTLRRHQSQPGRGRRETGYRHDARLAAHHARQREGLGEFHGSRRCARRAADRQHRTRAAFRRNRCRSWSMRSTGWARMHLQCIRIRCRKQCSTRVTPTSRARSSGCANWPAPSTIR